ncbi:MAG: O-antigen ligase family protein [Gemmatimonadota bacterium]
MIRARVARVPIALREGRVRWLIPRVIVVMVCVLVGTVLADQKLSVLLYILSVLALAMVISLVYPCITLALVILSTQMAGELLPTVLGLPLMVDLGSFNVHLHDPLVFGLLAAVCLHLFPGGHITRHLNAGQNLALMAFLSIVTLQTLRNIGSFGINAVGEARTYYAPLLLVPYCIVMLRTRQSRWRAFRTALILSLSFLTVAPVRGMLGMDIQLNVRVLNASGALALLCGMIGFKVAMDSGHGQNGRLIFLGYCMVAGSLLLFTAHRSVWLACGVAVLLMAVTRTLKIRPAAGLLLALTLGYPLAAVALRHVGYEPAEFLLSRAAVFVNPQQDATGSWRYYLWQEAIQAVSSEPLLGVGLGRHFGLAGPDRTLVYSSPHNLYVTILFHAGVLGLLLYLLFAGRLARSLLRHRTGDGGKQTTDRVIAGAAFIILGSAHAYYVAYVLEWITWVYVGIGAAVLAHGKNKAEGRHSIGKPR